MPCSGSAAVAQLRTAVDSLLELDTSRLTATELVELACAVDTQRRRLESVDQVVVAEMEQRRIADELHAASTAVVLRQALRISAGEARARVRAAEALGPRRDLAGQPLEPIYATVAAAQAAGEISAAHARVITSCVDALPAAVAAEHDRDVESTLTKYAHELDPDQLAVCARRVRDCLDPDGTLTDDADHERQRGLTLRPNRDGSGHLSGRLTPFGLAVWQAILDPLAAPKPAEDGAADPRTAAQRLHDALVSAGLRLLRSGTLPDAGGAPVTVAVTMTLEQLESRTGLSTTAHEGTLSVRELLREAAEAELIPTVLDNRGAVLDFGRTRRTASRAQRRALAARDRGCSYPGCDVPPSWCEAHHVQPWSDGGRTSLDNLTLLCGHHHRNVGHNDWTCRMTNGLPEWNPPPWLDPTQVPRHNHAHHPMPSGR